MNKSRTLIPKNWTPEQALTVFDLLIALQQAIWDLYQSAILRLLMEQDAPSRVDLFGDQPDLPFPS